jgi:hypothetical protein
MEYRMGGVVDWTWFTAASEAGFPAGAWDVRFGPIAGYAFASPYVSVTIGVQGVLTATMTTPQNNATNVSVNTNIVITFTEAVQNTANGTITVFTTGAALQVPVPVWTTGDTVATITLIEPLAYATLHIVDVEGFQPALGPAMQPQSFTFTTIAEGYVYVPQQPGQPGVVVPLPPQGVQVSRGTGSPSPQPGTPAFAFSMGMSSANRAANNVRAELSNASTADGVLAAIQYGLPAGVSARWSANNPFVVVPATYYTDGSVTGIILITAGTHTSGIRFNEVLPAYGETAGEEEEGSEE